jgi:ATP-binding protein involved in chromosome partitioning
MKLTENFPSLSAVKHIIAIASGKGGVGKSTVTVNLALALQQQGLKVGVLDADIYGPSIPTMLGISQRPESLDGKTIQPIKAHGLSVMSIGLLLEQAKTPAIWRGPMVSGALQQLIRDTQWGELDVLLIDLPPGTGDIQLTLCQKVPLTGAVIVTTPQDIALLDARKAIEMFNKVKVPVSGIVENMSVHICSQCGYEETIFGEEGGESLAKEYATFLLGQIPLAKAIRLDVDEGKPTVAQSPQSAHAQAFMAVADALGRILSLQA